MSVLTSEIEMPTVRRSPRIDLVEFKAQIVRKLGYKRSEKYFYYLKLLLGLKITKSEFNKMCYSTIGAENINLHNSFIRSIIKNACIAESPPTSSTKSVNSHNVNQRSLSMIYGDDVFPRSPRKGRSTNIRSCRFRDRPSPLRPHGQSNGDTVIGSCDVRKAPEHQSEVFSVEDGEEVEQMAETPYVQSRSPLSAPLGIQLGPHFSNQTSMFCRTQSGFPQTCSRTLELPDSASLKQRLECKLQKEGLEMSDECVNLLNNGLDTYLKRLIKPCLELAGARRSQEHLLYSVNPEKSLQRSDNHFSASFLEFQTAMQLNPQLLGHDWSVLLEKICLHWPND